MRRPLLLLGLLSALLSAALALELRGGLPGAVETAAPVASPEVAAVAPPPAEDATPERTRALVAAILARPLFEQDRRPTAEAHAGPAANGEARLAGIMVSPSGRAAIFAPAEGGKASVLREGDVLGPFTVQTIAPGAVTVLSHGKPQVMRPSFAASSATTTTPTFPLPQLPQFPSGPGAGVGRMPGLPGNAPPAFTTSFAVPAAPPSLLGPGPTQPSPESRP